MKQITIKSALMHRLVAVILLTLGTASVSAQYYMNVVQKDGEKVQYLVSNIDSVYFSSQEEPATNYEYVDLGLSVKWATCNVGATKPEEYGDYFAWGETEPYYEAGYAQEVPQAHWKAGKPAGYDWSSYKWCNGSEYIQTKYNTQSNYGTVDNKIILDLEDDVAHVKWGGNWRMPTKAEQDELLNSCTWTWYEIGNTEFSGIAGYKVTSKIEGYTDCSIFLPAAGYRIGVDLGRVGSWGYYWSSFLRMDGPSSACNLYFLWNRVNCDTRYGRYYGQSVRPVCP